MAKRSYIVTVSPGADPKVDMPESSSHRDPYITITQAIHDLGRAIDHLKSVRDALTSEEIQ